MIGLFSWPTDKILRSLMWSLSNLRIASIASSTKELSTSSMWMRLVPQAQI
jgi:hypothetical protein